MISARCHGPGPHPFFWLQPVTRCRSVSVGFSRSVRRSVSLLPSAAGPVPPAPSPGCVGPSPGCVAPSSGCVAAGTPARRGQPPRSVCAATPCAVPECCGACRRRPCDAPKAH